MSHVRFKWPVSPASWVFAMIKQILVTKHLNAKKCNQQVKWAKKDTARGNKENKTCDRLLWDLVDRRNKESCLEQARRPGVSADTARPTSVSEQTKVTN